MTNTGSSLPDFQMTVYAPAKINLHLKVTARRSDGYHELDISFLPLTLPADRVMLDFIESGLEMTCSDSTLNTADNLCLKAARAYAAAAHLTPGWRIGLDKQIPVAAGLGGGSSDAAAVLRLLNSHYQALTSGQLVEIAVKLGADVPFFLRPRLAFAAGIGEKLFYPEISWRPLPLLLVNPGFPISAAWAYQNLPPEQIGASPVNCREAISSALVNYDLPALGQLIRNDLEPAARDKFPLLELLRQFMLAHGAHAAAMSGSGSTMFALCRDFDHVTELAEAVRSRYPFCRLFAANP